MPEKNSESAKNHLPIVKISARGAERLKNGHVWVYRSDVEAEGIGPGALVEVRDSRGKSLGTALYSNASQIALRMVAPGVIGRPAFLDLVRQRIRSAAAYRERVVRNSDAYRVVFSEADELPGLIVDRYSDVLTIQVLTQAIDREDVRAAVAGTLSEAFRPSGMVERVEPRVRELEGLPTRESQLVAGEKAQTISTLNDVKFHFDALQGQKTGAFLDQRENYAAAEEYARGEALDVFCYQGGFALHLARKCEMVTGVDSSRPALEVAEQNAALNGRELEWIEGNAFDLLKDYATTGRQYDTIVLDPPAFAKTKRDLDAALRGYKELNLRALKMLRPGGVLVTCSCSYHVGERDFEEVVTAAALDAHRTVRVVEKRGQAKDHPVVAGVPETSYLKALVLIAI